MSLQSLLNRADIWRGGEQTPPTPGLSTGHAALDGAFGGWPRGALTELLLPHEGIGELELLLPALTALSHTGHWQAWIDPPHLPYAPALAQAGIELSRLLVAAPRDARQALWGLEQSLRSGVCTAVLGWPRQPDMRALRRLQLAAEAGRTAGVLFRPLRAVTEASPAALRLRLEPVSKGLRVHILKRRGGWTQGPVVYERPHVVA